MHFSEWLSRLRCNHGSVSVCPGLKRARVSFSAILIPSPSASRRRLISSEFDSTIVAHLHVDDFLFVITKAFTSRWKSADLITSISTKFKKVNQSISEGKGSLVPVRSIKYCGLIIDLDQRAIILPPEKTNYLFAVLSHYADQSAMQGASLI